MNNSQTVTIPGLSTEEHDALLTNVRRNLQSTVAPLIDAAEEAGEFPWQVLPAMAEFGYIAGSLTEKEGGYGLSNFDYAHLMREAGRVWLSLRVTINTQYMAARILAAHGTPKQKTNWLEPILRGEKPVWFAITEPDAGSDVASVKLRAVPKDDHYLLSGNKLWITNGATVDHGILLANVEMHMRMEAARALGLAAARALDLGQKARVECSTAKLYAAQAAHEVAGMAQAVFGGAGYSEDLPIERIFRDTRGAVIPEGTTEIQTLILGRELLGISAFK